MGRRFPRDDGSDARELLALIDDPKGDFDCIPMQGSGTFAVEAMIGSFIPRESKTLVLINGAYGKRIAGDA